MYAHIGYESVFAAVVYFYNFLSFTEINIKHNNKILFIIR